ncbi:hypothetical protein [Streptomyces cavernicola]|uniref:Small CPxCG-related zinc finger protein n=1 Tax=Streptomyces cavernicola TaxID=3043613 RepID=A0ABT6SHQ4_9ACTN|nr:hypothetical protein [Streptomyces sp. B-S-A6]MDI3407727.1 hypothetical protein [Streptomyces sp. B-S-A6]
MDSRPHHSDEQPGAENVVCSRCGARATDEQLITWTFSVEDSVRRYYCDDCARANIRSIEGRLDSSWW